MQSEFSKIEEGLVHSGQWRKKVKKRRVKIIAMHLPALVFTGLLLPAAGAGAPAEHPPQRGERRDRTMDPRYNRDIDPRHNRDLNPNYNRQVHPEYNKKINPRYQRSLNPTRNQGLDPRFNGALDPTRNPWTGYYIYRNPAVPAGVMARAGEGIFNLFGPAGIWNGFALADGSGGYNTFNLQAEWTGYLRGNGAGGFNFFDLAGEWTGYFP